MKTDRLTLLSMGIFMATVLFAVFLIVISPQWIALTFRYGDLRFPMLILGFALSLIFSVVLATTILIQFVRQLYGLSQADADAFAYRALFGLSTRAPLQPLLRVQEGRIPVDGPEAMKKVGGPGYLSVGHDSAVVTSHFGKLNRILGPGLHRLEAFEKIWDVVDLRPQRRTVKVDLTTRDGIPVHCEADVLFRIDGGGQPPTEKRPYPYTDEAVLKATTMKRRRADGSIQDWTARVSSGSLDGEIHDQLEKYSLDQFLAPSAEAESFMAQLEKTIFEEVAAGGADLGVKVEQVQLGPVLPDEAAISRQWLEAWQAQWTRTVAPLIVKEEARQAGLLEQERIKASVELLNEMLPLLKDMEEKGQDVDARLVLIYFLQIMRAMADREPVIQHVMFQQSESLHKLINAIQVENAAGDNGSTPKSQDAR